MKKFTLLLLAIGMMFAAPIKSNAQQLLKTTIGGTKDVDTTDNTESNYMYYAIPAGTKSISIQVVGTKISGAPNGCFTLEFSEWNPINTTNFVAATAADTVHMANSSTPTQGIWTKTFTPSTGSGSCTHKYLRVKSVGRGTASYKFQVTIYRSE